MEGRQIGDIKVYIELFYGNLSRKIQGFHYIYSTVYYFIYRKSEGVSNRKVLCFIALVCEEKNVFIIPTKCFLKGRCNEILAHWYFFRHQSTVSNPSLILFKISPSY